MSATEHYSSALVYQQNIHGGQKIEIEHIFMYYNLEVINSTVIVF